MTNASLSQIVLKFLLQIMLSDVDSSNFKRLAVFCAEKERKTRAFHRKMLIVSRNQLDDFLCSEAYNKLLFAELFVTDNKTL
jgi:hypothetical protein